MSEDWDAAVKAMGEKERRYTELRAGGFGRVDAADAVGFSLNKAKRMDECVASARPPLAAPKNTPDRSAGVPE